MKKIKFPKLFLFALLIGVGVLVLTIVLQPTTDDDIPHNHFIGSGEIDFLNDLPKDFNYNNTGESFGTGYNDQKNCIELSAYENLDIVHFHNHFKFPSSQAPRSIKTTLMRNGHEVVNPAPISIHTEIEPYLSGVSSANSTTRRIIGDILNPSTTFQILSSDFQSNETYIVIDIDIPKGVINESDFFQLVFSNFQDQTITNCGSCNNFTLDQLNYFLCIESNNCPKSDSIDIINLYPFCGPPRPQE